MKRRITITLDTELYLKAQSAVENGSAESVSAWINSAMILKMEKDHRLQVLADLVDDYEKEHGEISADELAEQKASDRHTAAHRQIGKRQAG